MAIARMDESLNLALEILQESNKQPETTIAQWASNCWHSASASDRVLKARVTMMLIITRLPRLSIENAYELVKYLVFCLYNMNYSEAINLSKLRTMYYNEGHIDG